MEKQRWEESARRSQEVRRYEMEKVRRKKMQVREKVGKSRFTVFFQWFCGSGGSNSNLAKAAGAEPAGQRRDEKVHAVVARSTFPSQSVKNPRSQTTFGSWDVEKVHAVAVWSTFPSQNVESTTCTDHSWKLRCRKSARCCGPKHISSQNGKNTTCSDHFLTPRCRKSARPSGAKHISKSKV